ncbi:MAG: methionyl-tRNA formyltransferase [Deltaproteobacteria bacterium]|nr:MAG: methionyl-tRNA formyltransferase [Deltaproteobacteria bacterium]
MSTIIIATPHDRNNQIEQRLSERFTNHRFLRIRNKEELCLSLLEQIQPEFIFFPHWSWLIPEDIHTRYECIIFHMTDLPYGRGGSPLQNLIVRGHTETQLTALKCVSELDAGPIYCKKHLSLEGTAEEILRRASHLIEDIIAEILIQKPNPQPQQGTPIIFKRRNRSDGNIASLKTLKEIYDFIRMLDADSYPPAFVETEYWKFEFNDAHIAEDSLYAKVRIRKKDV